MKHLRCALRPGLCLFVLVCLGQVTCGSSDCLEGYGKNNAGVCIEIGVEHSGSDTNTTVGTTEGLERYTPYFPTAAGVVQVAIPEALSTEDDRLHGNTTLDQLVDSEGAVLGYGRRIFTPVACVSGVCDAIVFVLVHNPDFSVLDVFHPPEELFKLMKYWEDEYLEFDEADMALVRTVLQERPEILLSVTDVHDLAEGTHSTAPTLQVFQDVVVRGGVFTVWVMALFAEDTEALLLSVFGEEG